MSVRLPIPPRVPDAGSPETLEMWRQWSRWGENTIRVLTLELDRLNNNSFLFPYASTSVPSAQAPFRLAMLSGTAGTGTANLQPIFNDGTAWRRVSDLTPL